MRRRTRFTASPKDGEAVTAGGAGRTHRPGLAEEDAGTAGATPGSRDGRGVSPAAAAAVPKAVASAATADVSATAAKHR